MAQSNEEPPFLTEGTDVSAKYRGAFCEANVKSVKKLVKCKVTFTKTNATVTINDDCIKGPLKVGALVEAKHPDGQFMEAVISKLTDASFYTVVFDDGDERTLRRTSLCLKGERHFNESETLDHLPLTDPENFGTPVVQNSKKRKKRRLSHAASMDEPESPKESFPQPSKKKCLFNDSVVGKVVLVKVTKNKRKNVTWFPGLGVSPDTGDIIKNKDHCLVRSFKDGKYHVVHIGDTKEYKKDEEPVCSALKGENKTIKLAVERTAMYLDTGKVPAIWEDSTTDCIVNDTVNRSPGENAVSSEDDEDEDAEKSAEMTEKKNFVDSLYAFMDGRGTPIHRAPVLGNQDLDLYKLYCKVKNLGGMEKVTSQQLWREVYSQMDIPVIPPSASHHIRMAYKKYLYAFEQDEMGATEVHSKDADNGKKDEEKAKSPGSPAGTVNSRIVKQKDADCKNEVKRPVKKQDSEGRAEQKRERSLKKQNSELKSEMKRERSSRRRDSEMAVDDKDEEQSGNPAKISKQEDNDKPEEKLDFDVELDSAAKSPEDDVAVDVVNSPGTSSDASESKSDTKGDAALEQASDYLIGDKIQVKYGKGKNQRIYEAKVVSHDPNADEGLVYCVHYSGWNTRYDEWIAPERILGRGTRQTRKRGSNLAQGQDLSPKSKLPSKCISKTSPKTVAKKGAKAAPVGNKPIVKTNAPVNGSKGSTRRQSVSPTDSSSPLLGKSAAVKSNSSRRTRSDRNSTELSNGLVEAKSPPSRLRRQRSGTPEPTPDLAKEKDLLSQSSPGPKLAEDLGTTTEEEQEGKPEVKTEDSADHVARNGSDDAAPSKGESYSHEGKLPTMLNSELDKQAECVSNGHRKKEKQKKPVVNGLISSSPSPETVQECSIDNAVEPKSKKVKIEGEHELPAKEIKGLLSDGTLEKAPSEPPLTTASPTSDETVASSVSTRLKTDSVEERKESSESEHSSSEKLTNSSDNSTDSARASKEKAPSTKEDRDEKKESDAARKHKKKREKKKHRHHSGNDSTGSDVPGSPMTSHSIMPRPSPTRSRISFDADLEEIKAKENGDERIKLLQEKINEMKKMYCSLKAEVASIDRRRKRQKKKREAAEEEESKASTNSATPANLAAVECR